MDGGIEVWLGQLQHWHWWVLGVVLLILEVTAPAVFFLWMGAAAGLVGLLLLLFPEMGWQAQVVWFSVLSVGSIGLWHGFLKQRPTFTDQPRLNRRGSNYIGRIFTLDEPIVNGVGRLRVDDTMWKVGGPDTPAGDRVKVTGVDGVVLQVVPTGPAPAVPAGPA